MGIWDVYSENRPFLLSGFPIFDDQEELKWRLNQQLKGEPVGKPFNWKGL